MYHLPQNLLKLMGDLVLITGYLLLLWRIQFEYIGGKAA